MNWITLKVPKLWCWHKFVNNNLGVDSWYLRTCDKCNRKQWVNIVTGKKAWSDQWDDKGRL